MEFIQSGYNWYHDSNYSYAPNLQYDKNNKIRLLVLLIRSNTRITLNGSEKTYKKPIVVLAITPFRIKYGGNGNERFINDWMEFFINKNELQESFGLSTNTIIENLSEKEIKELSKLIFNITYEQHNTNESYKKFIDTYSKLFFLNLHRFSSNNNHNNNKYYSFERIRKIIYADLQSTINLSLLAKQLNMSISNFRLLYKKFFGVTIQQDFINAKINHSKELLKNENQYSTYTIAELCGYNSYEHFLRQFKQQTGMTPSEYRKNTENDNVNHFF